MSESSNLKIWTLRVIGFILSLGILSVQLGKPASIMVICLALSAVAVAALHKFSPEKRNYEGKRPTPLAFEYYLSDDAAQFAAALAYSLIALNVLWALRWFSGVLNVCQGIYGIKDSDIVTLEVCAADNPNNRFGAPVCNVLASFIQRPQWLYCHASGAVTALALGPFQITESFRKNHIDLHRKMGYFYTCAVFIGGIGSCGLIATSKTGGAAGAGFMVLLCLWWFTLIMGIMAARKKDIDEHHIWMIRNYTYTFSAVPFRFLPGIFVAFGVGERVAYPIGTWFTVVASFAWSEYFVNTMLMKDKALSAAAANDSKIEAKA